MQDEHFKLSISVYKSKQQQRLKKQQQKTHSEPVVCAFSFDLL